MIYPDSFCPYAVLGVNEDVEPEVLKSAHKVLAAKYHPDRYLASDGYSDGDRRQAAERFSNVTLAYEILSDPSRRSEYNIQFRVKRESEPQPKSAPEPEPKFAEAWGFADEPQPTVPLGDEPVSDWGYGSRYSGYRAAFVPNPDVVSSPPQDKRNGFRGVVADKQQQMRKVQLKRTGKYALIWLLTAGGLYGLAVADLLTGNGQQDIATPLGLFALLAAGISVALLFKLLLGFVDKDGSRKLQQSRLAWTLFWVTPPLLLLTHIMRSEPDYESAWDLITVSPLALVAIFVVWKIVSVVIGKRHAAA